MDFAEEKTPAGYSLKILFNKWQFMVFDRKGRSVRIEKDNDSLLHPVPLIIFAGEKFDLPREFDREYRLLKVRKGTIIVPYIRRSDRATAYVFIPTDITLDLIPVRFMLVRNVAQMVREIDISYRPDYIIADEGISANDVIIMSNRYKVQNIIYAHEEDIGVEREEDLDRYDNLNILSRNPVFLARIHLRSQELSKVNQLLLDFDFSELETEYVAASIREAMEKEERGGKSYERLKELMESFTFYMHLLKRDTDSVSRFLRDVSDGRKMTYFRTLISKVKSIYPGSDDQILFTEYENMVMNRLDELKGAKV